MLLAVKKFLGDSLGRALTARPALSPQELAAADAGPLVVIGAFRTASGLGQSARACADGLEASGRAVIRVDASGVLKQVDLHEDPQLSAFPTADAGTAIVHLNPPELPFVLTALGLKRPKRWRIAGFWVYELEAAPPEWRRAEHFVSEVWTPSAFSAAALRHVYDGAIFVTPHFVRPPDMPQDAPMDGDQLRVLIMADGRSSIERKNVLGSIDAYKLGLSALPNSSLTVKTRNILDSPAGQRVKEMIEATPNATLVDGSVTDAERWRLIADCNILLSLHRSEGFGLVLAEAMSLGKAVVATGWSGSMEFMTDQSAFIAPFSLTAVNDADSLYASKEALQWAEPDVAAAASILERLVDPQLRANAGHRAKEAVTNYLGTENYTAALTRQARSFNPPFESCSIV